MNSHARARAAANRMDAAGVAPIRRSPGPTGLPGFQEG